VPDPVPSTRSLGTRAATLLGVTAIVGGAPIVMAGAAFAAAGPAALLAVALDGALAILGALALAELGARFPRSGGAYVFAQRVLGIESAFAVGWLVLFGSLAAAAVFALGFASFAVAIAAALLEVAGRSVPGLISRPALEVALALAAVAAYGVRAYRRPRRPPAVLTAVKVIGMAGIGAAGLVGLGLRPEALDGALRPFLLGAGGAAGLVGIAQAMGMMFIAFQGFVLISASAGDLRDPARTLPRASVLTIVIATALYLPLFLATATVGRPDGVGLLDFARATDATMVAVGAGRYLGDVGFWWVAATAVVAMLTALEAQLQGAARLARTMARDGTLPRRLARTGSAGVPRGAVSASAAVAALLIVVLPEVRTAGVAAGLIFMIVLALGHLLALIVRHRSDPTRLPYRAPWAPASLWFGGGAALAVAVVNAVTVPAAGVVALAWLLLGALVYIAALKTQARALDAELEGAHPDVVALRGRRPLVLTPIANPANAEALVSVAHALAPPTVGRVTLLHVVRRPVGPTPAVPFESRRAPTPPSTDATESPDGAASTDLATAQRVLGASLEAAVGMGLTPQALTTLADDPWEEIARVARTLDCEGLLVGLSDLHDEATLARLDELLGRVRSDVVVLRAPEGWHLERCRKVVVPFAGRADQERLRARVLASLSRLANPHVEVVRLLPEDVGEASCRRVQRQLERLVEGRDLGRVHCIAEPTDDPVGALTLRAADADLLVLGLPRRDASGHALGAFAAAVAAGTPATCAVMLIHARS
jgi:basic amino acid/polyamine antiporter, APA family